MNRLEHLLTRVMEECAEVAQRASKAMVFGLSEVQATASHGVATGAADESLNNAERIMVEFHELVAVMEMAGLHPRSLDDERIRAKKAKVERFLKYSAECGTLDGPAAPAPSSSGGNAASPEEIERRRRLDSNATNQPAFISRMFDGTIPAPIEQE